MTNMTRGTLRDQWTPDQREQMRTLERLRRPSQWDRGALAALAATTCQPGESGRVERLRERWAKK